MLEVIGAFILVWSARSASMTLKKPDGTWKGTIDAADSLAKIIRGVYQTEKWGFMILAFGLFMQFIGGFSQYDSVKNVLPASGGPIY